MAVSATVSHTRAYLQRHMSGFMAHTRFASLRLTTAFDRVYHPDVDLPALKAFADNFNGVSLGSPFLAPRRPLAEPDADAADSGDNGGGKRRQSGEGSGGAARDFQPPEVPPPVQSMDTEQAQAAAGLAVSSAMPEARAEEGGPSKRIKTLWSMSDQSSSQPDRWWTVRR